MTNSIVITWNDKLFEKFHY